jgi:hypothetical protein
LQIIWPFELVLLEINSGYFLTFFFAGVLAFAGVLHAVRGHLILLSSSLFADANRLSFASVRTCCD